MEVNHKLGLYVSYYPARFDEVAYQNLGFGNQGKTRNCFVEVKGLSEYSGGIRFTSKEWTVAKTEGENYFLCIISNLNEQPEIIFIQNPFEKLKPKKNIFTSIQISWSVSETQPAEYHD